MPYQNNARSNSGRGSNTRSFSAARPFKPAHKRAGGSNSRPSRHGTYIHPSKFVNRAVAVEQVAYESTHVFADFPFTPALQQNIIRKGYEVPSAIQDQAIPFVLDGRDVIGLANTGTGKTAAFLLPIINQLLIDRRFLSVLILAPTRELAQQIDEQFREFAAGLSLYSTVIVGGMNMDRQISQLGRRPHVVIGTPGRTMDLIKRSALKLDSIDILVLDEADRMLDMGFVADIRTIASKTPSDRQTLFFSATITPEIQRLTDEFLRNPEIVSVRTADTSESVDQDIIEVETKDHRLDKLVELLQTSDDFEKVLVFGETKFGVQRLSDSLEKSGVSSVAIHGNKSQSQRQRALKAFRDDKVQVLVATDVAARGLDIPDVSHVINFDQPATYDDYVHRIGRTGRGGKTGKAFTFVGPQR